MSYVHHANADGWFTVPAREQQFERTSALVRESALGVQHMAEIACASPRVVSLSLGAEDFARDISVEPTPEGSEQAYGKGMVIVAARLAGVQPMGLTSTLANFTDLDGLTRSAT